MSNNTYELVFYGALVEGFTEAQTKQHVAQLFKTSTDQVERMFTGNRVVIRNKLDQETALKYIIAMKKRGADCQIEAMGAPGIKVDFSQPAPPQTATNRPSPVEGSVVEAKPVSGEKPVSSTNTSSVAPSKTNASHQSPNPVHTDNLSGLQVAGEKVDEILSHSHLSLDPTGVRLADKKPEVLVEHHVLDDVSLAPVGADLCDEKEELPVSLPDISNLSLEPEND